MNVAPFGLAMVQMGFVPTQAVGQVSVQPVAVVPSVIVPRTLVAVALMPGVVPQEVNAELVM